MSLLLVFSMSWHFGSLRDVIPQGLLSLLCWSLCCFIAVYRLTKQGCYRPCPTARPPYTNVNRDVMPPRPGLFSKPLGHRQPCLSHHQLGP